MRQHHDIQKDSLEENYAMEFIYTDIQNIQIKQIYYISILSIYSDKIMYNIYYVLCWDM